MARARVFSRLLEVMIAGLFGVAGLALIVAGRLGPGIALLAFAVFAVVMFEWRFVRHAKVVTRVREAVEEAARGTFDAPATVQERARGELVEALASNPRIARMIDSRSTRFFARGTYGGKVVELGSTVIASRDSDQAVSYACVIDGGLRGPFRLMTKGLVTKLARIGMDKHPVLTGDAAFDARWIVDADEARCRAVLDERLRVQLLELPFKTPETIRIEQQEARLHRALFDQPARLETHPTIAEVATAVGTSERHVNRKVRDLARRFRLPFEHWRAALHGWCRPCGYSRHRARRPRRSPGSPAFARRPRCVTRSTMPGCHHPACSRGRRVARA